MCKRNPAFGLAPSKAGNGTGRTKTMNHDSNTTTTSKWAFGKSLVWAVAGCFPLTPLGLVAIPLLVRLLLAYGLDRRDKVLLAVTVGGLALLALMLGKVLFTAFGLWLLRD